MRWHRFSVRTIFLVTFVVAVFFAGYQVGFHAGRDLESWEDVGGLGSTDPFPFPNDPFALEPIEPLPSSGESDDPFGEPFF